MGNPRRSMPRVFSEWVNWGLKLRHLAEHQQAISQPTRPENDGSMAASWLGLYLHPQSTRTSETEGQIKRDACSWIVSFDCSHQSVSSELQFLSRYS